MSFSVIFNSYLTNSLEALTRGTLLDAFSSDSARFVYVIRIHVRHGGVGESIKAELANDLCDQSEFSVAYSFIFLLVKRQCTLFSGS